ncbi:MAG: flagellar biosynthesis protein [Clostridiales bacterium]|nr:flagellar biosynthesis protein [Clostridiales bacterium]
MRSNEIYRISNDNALRNIAAKKSSNGFDALFKQEVKKAEQLQFSKHSKERIEERGISLTDQLMEDMNAAIGKARLKGAKDVVMIGKDAAFIVNVPNNVVVTAISSEEMKDNIFTNIDSAVIL